MSRKTVAVLLNAFVLPGLGQLYLGRKTAGIALIMIVNLLLLLGLFVILKGLAPVIAAKAISGSVTPQEIQNALQSAGPLGKMLLAGIVLVWGYAIVDTIRNGDAPPPES